MVDLHPRGSEPSEGLFRRPFNADVSHAQLVHHHRSATAGGGEHADARTSCRPRQRWHAHHQRQGFNECFQRIDPRNAAVFQEGVGDVVSTGERSGMRHGKFGSRSRAPQLVGDDGLAACGRSQCKLAQLVALAYGFKKQQVAADPVIVQACHADFTDAQIDFIADRDQPGEADAAFLAA